MPAALVARTTLLPWTRAAADPEGLCLVDERHRLVNRELAQAVDSMSLRLSRGGVGAGDTVAVLLPNCVEHVVSLFAAWHLGAVVTPVDVALSPEHVVRQLQDAGALVLVADEVHRALSARAGAAFVGRTQVLDVDLPPLPPEAHTTAPGDFALVLYTPGASEAPVGIVLDHSNLASMCDAVIDRLGLRATDRALLLPPLSTCDGMIVSTLATLVAGGEVVMACGPDVDDLLRAVHEHPPTFFCAAPDIFRDLATAPAEHAVVLASLRFAVCTSRPLPSTVREHVEQRARLSVVEGCSVPEGSGIVALNPVRGRRKPGTAGLPMLGHDLCVTDFLGRCLPAGSVGEVVVRGRAVMRGYLGRPAATAEVLRDGWLRTGVVGYLDEDGHLVPIGRADEALLRGQQQVHPAELEATLRSHDSVVDALVTGCPDPVLGEVPIAHVVVSAGALTSGRDLLLHCRKTLDHYKVPDAIHVVTALPAST
jgi:long-chain acyl-CoA synthetase